MRPFFFSLFLLASAHLQGQVMMMFFSADSSAFISSPADLDSLFYWFAADVGVTDSLGGAIANNEGVGTWEDLSGNGYDVVQDTNTWRPVWKATGGPNGYPAIQFDGTNDFLASAAHWWGSDDLTVFVVMKNANATRNATEAIISKGDGGSNLRQWNYRTENNANGNIYQLAKFKDGVGTNYDVYKHGVKSTSFRLLSIVNNGTRVAFIDGASSTVTSVSFGTGDHTILNSSQIVSIGAQKEASYANFLQGSISEIIVYTRALTASERVAIELYLNRKYDLY